MKPRFSILLPTKNRLDLLRYAVETVRRQSYADWEIVVSDNVSEDDIAGYVAGLNEPRVKYVRAPGPLPVTDNWNLALGHSTGDYVIMLGDDDGLLKGYLETAARLIDEFGEPELVLTDALLYAYPNVIPGRTSGFLQIGYGVFFDGKSEPYLLDRQVARQAVENALDFRLTYQFNMQYSIVSRRLVERSRSHGQYFQSPYPDFYASNANLLLAEKILIIPKPMVCIGISPKSFGYYYFNRRQQEGSRFLGNMGERDLWARLARYLLPGNDLFSCWLAAVDTVRANLSGAPAGGTVLRVGYQRYRFLQLWFAANSLPRADLVHVWLQAKWWEWLVSGPAGFLLVFARRFPRLGILQFLKRRIDGRLSPLPDRDTRVRDIPARNMLEVFDTVPPEYYGVARRPTAGPRVWEIMAREASRKILIGGRQRAYWGPGGIARLLGRAIIVLASEGPGGVVHKLNGLRHRALARADYAAWVDEQSALEAQRRGARLIEIGNFAWNPLISILMPTYNSPIEWLGQAIDSVLAQDYPHWELCIADDASPNAEVRTLLKEYAAREPRIRLVFRETNGHISAATNSALEIARGEFISLMDHDDLIAPFALFELVRALNRDPALDMVYSDEDKIDTSGVRFEPFFKPDWSPDYLESCMYTAHLAVYRKALVDRIGGFRSEVNGAQDYDFVLRFTELTDRIAHVPRVLYNWRAVPGSTAASMQQKSYVVAAGVRGLQERLSRTGRQGSVQSSEYAGCFVVRWALPRQPLVSIVIPTAGGDRAVRGQKVNLVTRCVEKIRAASTYVNYEIVIVDNGDLRPEVLEALRRCGCRFTTFLEAEFNISKKLNLGVRAALGEYLLLLNDDIELITPDWIEAMLEQALKPGVGVVGAKLLYENGTIQHVGVAHHNGLPDHVRKHFPGDDPGYNFSTSSARNYLAVTGACMLTSAEDYRAVGGYDEAFKINYSDIDYCLKLRRRGLRAVYTPHAALYHYESASRKAEVAPEEIDLYLQRWTALTVPDPYYNGDYLQTSPPDFTLALRS